MKVATKMLREAGNECLVVLTEDNTMPLEVVMCLALLLIHYGAPFSNQSVVLGFQ